MASSPTWLKWAAAGVAALLLLPRPRPRLRVAMDIQARAIPMFGGRDVDPLLYPESPDGFGAYLAEVGVRHWTVGDIILPRSSAIGDMREWGFDYLLPGRRWWPRGAALFLLADRMVEANGGRGDAQMNYWWRPDSAPNVDLDPRPGGGFNAARDGEAQGDHPDAYAVDIDWGDERARAVAEGILETLYDRHRWLELSYGVGRTLTHFGIGSREGRRRWTY